MSDVTTHFQFRGKPCEAQVFRTPDETLPRVKDEEGNEYVDNRITLRITSQGKTLVDRTFTKDNFASVVEQRFLQHSIFEGLVYDTDVKITDTAGRVIATGRSNGGTFSWDCRDAYGREVATGVYMVVASDPEGKNGIVTKITVIR